MASSGDTIAAVSSGAPPAAIAIIRVSGPDAQRAVIALAGSLPPPRQAALRALRDVEGQLLDHALVLVFPGPATATGEDLVELHCHGGRAVVEAVEGAIVAQPNIRRAEPGEFTRRALLNGRIDLTEAEGLADLLEAETESQRRAAMSAASGQVSRALRGWLDRVALLSARVEAAIDYAEEGDVEAEDAALAGIGEEQQALAAEMAAVLAHPPVERWRDGVKVVLAGPPNSGKSTLVNLLGGREAAIVSPIAGTTRDRIEVTVRRAGVGYVLVDTAGLHEATHDEIERVGMARAREAVDVADLVLWLGDGSPPVGERVVRVHGRADIPGRGMKPPEAELAVSARDAHSVEALWALIEDRTSALVQVTTVPLHRREWQACAAARSALLERADDLVLQAECLRQATVSLSAALGLQATEQMLDALFSRFCVGK